MDDSSGSTEFSEQTQQLPQMRKEEQYEIHDSAITSDPYETSEVEDQPPDSEWMISIKKKLEQARQDEVDCSRGAVCIYRVPHYLREGDETAYLPQVVSLGPFHHGNERVRQMDRHKWRALHRVLERTKHDIKLYLDAVKELEDRARNCYEGSITLSSNEFVEMMVLDGCFVTELLQGVVQGFRQLGYLPNDPIFAMRGSIHAIQRDMIMLENQLPLCILNRLLELQTGERAEAGFASTLILHFLNPLIHADEPLEETDCEKPESLKPDEMTFDPLSYDGGLHCLHVFRRSLLRRGSEPEHRIWMEKWSDGNSVIKDRRSQQLVHCVTELREAGIKFKKRSTNRFWDITFKNGTLHIPKLLIHNGTKSLFLNLIAFEQCHPDCGNKITSYAVFMDNLINSQQDVAYLHYCGIIEHWLGSDAEVADLFNGLCQEVIFERRYSYLSRLSKKVNRYYNRRWHTWRATLNRKYFSSPWSFISFVAAVIFLLLSFLQTFYGAYSYYNRR
ncbi:hypothetical protein CJ030_MR5G017513 [Morella rubra]|uniref:Uncharacterized protein n=1 Tax=Morella rubra TaxID=262757 RepID=A0A6A1VVZ0_9ROSI|nr:hypothetical protein CJ030_MR5G017513 [Morella rubra]